MPIPTGKPYYEREDPQHQVLYVLVQRCWKDNELAEVAAKVEKVVKAAIDDKGVRVSAKYPKGGKLVIELC